MQGHPIVSGCVTCDSGSPVHHAGTSHCKGVQQQLTRHPNVNGCTGCGSGSLDIPFCVCVCRCLLLHFTSLSPSSLVMDMDAGNGVDVYVDVSVDIGPDKSVMVFLFTSVKRFHSSTR